MASAAPWSEIARFSYYWGTAPNIIREEQTSSFTCNSNEWRIVWNYTPLSNILDPENVYFNIFIYRTNETNYMMDTNQQGSTITNGTIYIHGQGSFYLKFLVYNILNATAVIEQYVKPAPEFPPMFLLPLFISGTLLVVMLARNEVCLHSRARNISSALK